MVINDMFVKEDISKPENRINLAIFHLQMYENFHDWFMAKLNLKKEFIVYPMKNDLGVRPDYIIKNGHQIVGYAEVECGQNVSQLECFKGKFEKNGIKVYSICGRKYYDCDLSLEEIKDFCAAELKKELLAPQIKLSLNYLRELIELSLMQNINNNIRTKVNWEFVKNHEFLWPLLAKLADVDMVEGSVRPYRGRIFYDTVKEKGFSLRVYSPEGARKQIALLSVSGGRDTVIFQAAHKYKKYLCDRNFNDVNKWINFICATGYDINMLAENDRVEIPLSAIVDKVDNFASIIKKLV